ncbi:short-subunit dehydrogenase involved in D-alanine esterification of teichoic acids [Paraburkholderia sp. GAS33]
MKLSGNTIFITGATSGIGRGLAEAFHSRGNKVIIGGRRKALLDEVTRANPGMDAVEIDVSSPAQIASVTESLKQKYPALNVLINNAGIMPFDDVTGPLDDAQAVHLVNTNLLGPVRISGALIEHLKKQPEAFIINNSSVVAYIPMSMAALYSRNQGRNPFILAVPTFCVA